MKKKADTKAKWFHYLLAIMAGAFLVNTLPHFINGISGREFPTPFANPPGVGLSSPTVNMLWATINFAIGIVLFTLGKVNKLNRSVLVTFLISFFVFAFMLASYFGGV